MSSLTAASTSTNHWGHESYETFQVKALALGQKLFGDRCTITVEHMQGGGNNRVVGIKVKPEETFSSWYVLRIPREPEVINLDEEAAAFMFVEKYANIACPQIIAYDAGNENPINSPYMIFRLLDGECLYPGWDEILSLSEKLKVAKQLGIAFRKLIETRNSCPGWPAFLVGQSGTDKAVYIESFKHTSAAPFFCRAQAADRPWEPTSPPVVTVAELIIVTFDYHIDALPDSEVAQKYIPAYISTLRRLQEMAKQMDARGLLNLGYSLHHNDIAGRNIMFDWSTDNEDAALTLLDWDEVSFAPTFMACKAPEWVWTEDGSDPLDNEDHCKQRREAFEAAAGPEYARYAHLPVYDMARELVSFVYKRTVCSFRTNNNAICLLAQWVKYCRANPVNTQE